MWQCGGSVEVLPCARIAHIERAHKPYTEDLTSHVRRNALRVAEVWMDEFKSHVYMAWNIPVEVSDHRHDAFDELVNCGLSRSSCDVLAKYFSHDNSGVTIQVIQMIYYFCFSYIRNM